MLVGKYSAYHYIKLRNDEEKKDELNEQMSWFFIMFLIWISAICSLIYYWDKLERWAQIICAVSLLNPITSFISLALIIIQLNTISSEPGATSPSSL